MSCEPAYTEQPLLLGCDGDTMVGILSVPRRPAVVGVVIIVGGPQYRAGSHRQFVLLARHLAQCGVAALRFDYRGMGDATGPQRHFENVGRDIQEAIDGLVASVPTVRRVVLVGLCDAASAALLYVDEHAHDERVGGLVLLNPWVRSAQTLAKTHVRHYYWRRLREPDFWRKLLTGGVARRAVQDLIRNLRLASGSSQDASASLPFQSRMARGGTRFRGTVWLFLSGDDYTAKEFRDVAESEPAWAALKPSVLTRKLEAPTADHTLSDASDRRRFEAWCGDELASYAMSLQ